MVDEFNPFEYLAFLKRNVRFAAIAVVSAGLWTAGISSLLAREYTANATLVIEPPAVNDTRAATAVSSVYLESLKTYEQFAGSDTLFAKACAKFGLSQSPGEPCPESFKRRVLRVTKVKDTKVLRIAVTLPDAIRAQQLVEFLANESVALNRNLAADGDRQTLADVQTQLTAATAELHRARADYESSTAGGADQLLEEEVRTSSELKARAALDAQRSRASLAELSSRGDTTESASERARLDSLSADVASLDGRLAAQTRALAAARAQRERAEEALHMAEAKHEAWSRRANEAAVATGLRTEQLRVVDPGVVPQQPSFPDVPLFAGAALLVSALLTFAYLSLRYGFERQRARLQLAARLHDLSEDYEAARGGHR